MPEVTMLTVISSGQGRNSAFTSLALDMDSIYEKAWNFRTTKWFVLGFLSFF